MTTSAFRRLAAGAVGVVALAQGAASAEGPIRLTRPVQATKDDLNPSRTYSAPAFAVDPGNAMTVVGSYVEMRTRRCGLMRSTDGGQTWRRLEAAPALPSYPYCFSNNRGSFHAPVAFGRGGALYLAMAGWDSQDGGPGGNVSLLVAHSTDLGDTWRTTLARDNRGKEGESREGDRPVSGLVVDATTGSQDTLYVVFGRRSPGTSSPNQVPSLPMVTVSRDAGKTFDDPVNLAAGAYTDAVRDAAFRSTTTVPGPTTATTSPPAGSKAATPNQVANFGGFGPAVAIDAKGTAYVVWPSTTANLGGTRIPTGLFVSRSADKGRTWAHAQIGTWTFNNGSFVAADWSPEGGAQGTLHVVHEGTDRPAVTGYSDVYHRRSTDGGRTWTNPKNLTDDNPDDLFGQYIPNVTVAPDGRVDVAWWDTRHDVGIRVNDVYYVSSADNGTTWTPNTRVTDRSIDRRIGVWATNFDVNSAPSLAATNAYTLFGWDDTRNADPTVTDNAALGGGLQDIYTAAAQYEAVGGGTSNAVKAVLAGIVGLVVVGAVLLAVALATGGRPGGGTSRRARAEPAPTPAEVG